MIKSKKILFLTIFILILGLYVLMSFPIMKYKAEKSTYEYMLKQGISSDNISQKKIYKEYKVNGYVIEIKLKDDPMFRYKYEYIPDKGLFKYQLMLTIFNKGEEYVISKKKDGKIPKYLPLDK